MKTIILILVLAFTVSAQKNSDLSVEYDRFKDRTTISFTSPGVSVWEVVGVTFAGKEPTGKDSLFYVMFSGNRCRGFCFNNAELNFLIDGERSGSYLDASLDDVVYYGMTREMMEKLANAKLVEYKVGRFEGKWTAKTLGKIKQVLDSGTAKP